MQKTAQKRSLLNKLREVTNISGIATEKLFNPEFEEVMNRLRDETDDPVRAIVTGEQIGETPAPSDGVSLKSLLASVKSNLNRREYMKATADLGRFHKKMFDVVTILSGFRANLDKVHERFLFQDLDEDSQRHLHELHSRFSPSKTASVQPYFLKQANILDFFANIGTERGRALSAWEKRYPKQISELKKSSVTILSQSEKLLSVVISTLKEMASARAIRNPDKYINASSKIIKAFDNYDKSFKSYYENTVKPFEHIISGFSQKKVDVSDKPEELGSKEVAPEPKALSLKPSLTPLEKAPTLPVDKSTTDPSPSPFGMSSGPSSSSEQPFPLVQIKAPHSGSPPSIDAKTLPVPPPSMNELPNKPSKMTPEEMREFEAQHLGLVETHKKFYKALQKMSNESPSIIASFIKKYALNIQYTDLSTAVQLLKVANSIKR